MRFRNERSQMETVKSKRIKVGISQYRLELISGVKRHRISTHEQGYTSLTKIELLKIYDAIRKLNQQKTSVANE